MPEVSSSLIGASKPEYVIQNAEAVDINLSNEILDKIDEVLENKPTSNYR